MRLPLLPRPLRWAVLLVVAGLVAGGSVVRPPPGAAAFGPFGVLRLAAYGHLVAYAGFAGALAYSVAKVGGDLPWRVCSVYRADCPLRGFVGRGQFRGYGIRQGSGPPVSSWEGNDGTVPERAGHGVARLTSRRPAGTSVAGG